MRAKPLAELLCGVVCTGIAACGSGTAPDTTAPRFQTPTELRFEAQELLQSTENEMADVIGTAEHYATAHIDRSRALKRLDAAQNRAQALGNRAGALPTTSAARKVLMTLAAELATAATTLRNLIQSGQVKAPADVRSELSRLRDQAVEAFHRLRDRLPFIARRQVQRTVDTIFSLTG